MLQIRAPPTQQSWFTITLVGNSIGNHVRNFRGTGSFFFVLLDLGGFGRECLCWEDLLRASISKAWPPGQELQQVLKRENLCCRAIVPNLSCLLRVIQGALEKNTRAASKVIKSKYLGVGPRHQCFFFLAPRLFQCTAKTESRRIETSMLFRALLPAFSPCR